MGANLGNGKVFDKKLLLNIDSALFHSIQSVMCEMPVCISISLQLIVILKYSEVPLYPNTALLAFQLPKRLTPWRS